MQYYCIIDFECTCNGDFDFPNEIIEFPAIFINPITLKTEYEFHHYVKPTENAFLTQFCTELTGISQSTVDSALTLSEVLELFETFINEKKILPVTDGPWDFNKFLVPECKRKNLPIPKWCMQFMDVRWRFKHIFKLDKWLNLAGMLDQLGLVFEGREHSGIDDATNIGRILVFLINREYTVNRPNRCFTKAGEMTTPRKLK